MKKCARKEWVINFILPPSSCPHLHPLRRRSAVCPPLCGGGPGHVPLSAGEWVAHQVPGVNLVITAAR